MYLAVAFLLVACATIVRDLLRLSLAADVLLLGALCVTASLALALDVLARGLERGLKSVWSAASVVLVSAVVPGAWGLWRYSAATRSLSMKTPLAVASFMLIAGAVLFLLGRRANAKGRALATAWALAASALCIYSHVETETFASVRKGTELLHIALFLGTWGASLLVVVAAALRAEATRGLRIWGGLAGVVLGLSLLECDRRMFVDLYIWVHVWLGVNGAALTALGLATLLELRWPQWPTRPLPRLVSVGVVTAIAASFVLLAPGHSGPQARASVAHSPLGESLLELLPTPRAPKGELASPALNYAQHFDTEPAPEPYNILLVTVDALRGDALANMPRMQEIGSEGAVFSRAYAGGSRTAIGTGTLMTGRYSANMDWRLWIYTDGKVSKYTKELAQQKLDQKQRFMLTTVPVVERGNLLAERLDKQGYNTLAIPFAGKNEFFRRDLVFAHGFDRFVDLTRENWKTPTSKRIIDRALQEREQAKKSPWFHWIHLYDAHESRRNKAKYDEYTGIVDGEVGRFVDALRASGEWDKTVFVLLADHGEAFGEHRHQTHATSLYDEQIRVPFVLRVPGIAPTHIDEPVAAIDATATLSALAGAKTNDLDGVNLLPRLRGQVGAEIRPVFSELHRYKSSQPKLTADLKAVMLGDYKLIHNRLRNTQELYNLRTDPNELQNLIATEPQKFEELSSILRSFLARAEAKHALPQQP